MIVHPDDEDLILLFYRKLDPPAATRIESHLAACDTCRAGWNELSDLLRDLDAEEIPEPPEAFERVMWVRVSQALPGNRRWSWRQIAPLAGLSAATAALLMVIAVAPWPGPAEAPEGRETAPAAKGSHAASHDRTQKRVLFTALDDHLAQAELLLIELMNAPANGEREFQFERETAGDLLASGRLYRATARETRDGQFTLVLEDIERVLVEIARSPARVGRAELESLRGRIADDDLLFKVRAAASEVRLRQQNLMTVSEGTP